MGVLEHVERDVVCRSREIKQLISLLGHPNEPVPPSLFIFGHKSSGKSYTLCKVLNSLGVNHAVVNCVEGYMPRLIFESIISQLKGENSTLPEKCEDMMEFISQLNREASTSESLSNEIQVIVLEESERLRDMNPTILPAFLRLQELCKLNRVCVVFVSNLVWSKFNPPGGLSVPIEIFFPQYTQSEIMKILSLNRPKQYPEDFYLNYLQIFVAVFLRSCRDIQELQYKVCIKVSSMIFDEPTSLGTILKQKEQANPDVGRHVAKALNKCGCSAIKQVAHLNFKKYCEPIEKGEIELHDTIKLFHYIKPHLKNSLQVVYMRMETDEAHIDDSKEAGYVDKRQGLSSSAKFALSFELPYYAKYFLIAAYLASYNSPKEDKKLFVKLSGRTKKKVPRQHKNSQAQISLQMVGPRQFDLERLLAIFYSIVEERPHISVNLLTQITTLVNLQLLLKVGDDQLDTPRYKCAVGLDFIIIISKTVSFSITKYLADYK